MAQEFAPTIMDGPALCAVEISEKQGARMDANETDEACVH